ncbi:MAG: exodeoxyribonuclease VII small subunit [Phycisphaerales bacterium]|nr:exodeoxyribonuclease VII small subunit [Phycisphaerales bacterium]
MSKSKSKAEQEVPYEQLVEQLEGIVDQIEGGELGLEDSIKGYEQGIELVKRARMILDRAEQRITELNADTLGSSED